jgi:hypothetical protein
MSKTTPFFDGLHIATLGRKHCSAGQIMADELAVLRQKSFQQLAECFSRFIPDHLLRPSTGKAHSRQRVFSKANTFWAFFSQILDADGGCKEVVRKLQAYLSLNALALPASSTSAYCQARKKLITEELMEIFDHTVRRLDSMPERGVLHGRRVIVVDGTGLSMPDTPANQNVWPQQSQQKDGCGFPTARICACFSLATGSLLSFKTGNKKSMELPLFRQQWNVFRKGDIFLGDKGFCSYYDLANLKKLGVDSVITLARRYPVAASDAKRVLGKNDLLISWPKPVWYKKAAYSHEQWEALPERLDVRQIHVTVSIPGFRTQSFYIITTLLDAGQYTAEELAGLYLQRWNVELFFRDIKTTLGMDALRCKSPEMVEKEIIMHFIAYNSIRMLMYEAAEEKGVDVNRLSFKGTLQALRQWEPHLNYALISSRKRNQVISRLYDAIAENEVPHRPGRSEPRCVKRRPKAYQLLTKARHLMKEIPHRSKYRAKNP